MKLRSQIWLGFKALSELGPAQVGLYTLYQFGLRSGYYQRVLTASLSSLNKINDRKYLKLHPCLPALPAKDILLKVLGDWIDVLYEQADEIVDGKVRLFGGQPVPLQLSSPEPLEEWTIHERGNNRIGEQDIKFIWEPGRFGWAYTLARAYYLSEDDRYAQAFWVYTERFLTSNPPYKGPHWSSAQEVAIRLIALAFAYQVFAQSDRSTSERLENLAGAIAIHAERIPPTMVYARSQNNNHLIMEALGLYTASALLREHPMAKKWHKLGWKWLNHAFRTQIARDGTYNQHSTNYHRLVLQAALWSFSVHQRSFDNETFPAETTNRLITATQWLRKIVDPESGRVPNLGHNDGAYLLPLTTRPYDDYRPVIHAASLAFLHTNLFPEGAWNDLSYWLGFSPAIARTGEKINAWRNFLSDNDLSAPHVILNQANNSWAVLRTAVYHSRPAHVDQLHLDLWWRSLNLALDPGTFQYNSPAPWENSLASAFVHNTITIDNQEFMQRAGRFLYLDWAQAIVLGSQYDPNHHSHRLTASHSGYRKLGITHTRSVTAFPDGHWEIIDRLTSPGGPIHTIRLHWLLPDWEYEIRDATEKMDFPWYEVRIRSPYGWVSLKIGDNSLAKKIQPAQTANFQLVRAGELIYGSGSTNPISGWTSPTYGYKIPALACILEVSQALPLELKSEWMFPDET